MQAVRNAGGPCVVKEKQDNEQMESGANEGEKSGATATTLSAGDTQPNNDETEPLMCEEEQDINEIEPLVSEEEPDTDKTELMSKEELDMDEMNEVSYGEMKIVRRRHKFQLLLSKGCVVIVSGSVLIVGVVLSGLVHHDYSTCEPEEMSQLPVLLQTMLPVTRVPLPTPT